MGLVRLHDPAAAERFLAAERASGKTVGFVPTMGALHEGHLGLVRAAAAENDLAAVSIFVNPLQFDDPRDLERYPRDFDADAELLAGAGCALAFTGSLGGFFPGARSTADVVSADPGPAARGLEGEHRAGHFEGVATIVRRLFEIVRPERAYFGEKDFQQTLVVRHVSRVLREEGGPDVEIRVCGTSREDDGLARSSRNLLLDPTARARAVSLSRGLFAARAAWRGGERDVDALETVLRGELVGEGIETEYAVVLDPDRWGEWIAGSASRAEPLVRARALVAAKVWGESGRERAVRLIDNLSLSGPA
ncbi:MAG TPA: pantoate--beta-alanine ligase [Planctomycetes bacterium]|nr:pantoate--beta-alanine ligase [Planctomycetota bacterium]